MVGWNSVVNSHHFSPEASQLKANAQRYEGGSVNMPGQLALGASIELLRECNLAEAGRPLTTSITDRCNYLVESLQRIGVNVCRAGDPKCHSGIVPFTLPGIDSAAVRAHLLKQDVVLSVRHGFLRAAVHGYNSTSDVDRLVEGISELMR
jgi:selenocysteine lyase/cysteine desulfurase